MDINPVLSDSVQFIFMQILKPNNSANVILETCANDKNLVRSLGGPRDAP